MSPPTARIYTPFFPFPFTEGSFPLIHDQARALADQGWRVEMVVWKDDPARIQEKLRSPGADRFDERVRITYLPAPAVRSLSAAEILALPTTPRPDGGTRELWARMLRSLVSRWASPELFHYPPALDLRDNFPPAELGIYHYSFAIVWLSGRAAPESRVCVHLHNLESELARTRAGSEWSRGRRFWSLMHRVNAVRLARHERLVARHADELWFVSDENMKLESAPGSSELRRHLLPTLPPGLRERRRRLLMELGLPRVSEVRVGYVGGFDFEPNRLSAEWIVERLAPELERLGFRGRLVLAGRNPPLDLVRRSRRFPFLEWTGFVPNLEEFWAGLSFFLVPHVRGSGIRVKLLEALASGIPVLATEAALRPAPALRELEGLVVSDDPATWAARIMAESEPFATRLSLDGPFPRLLRASDVYAFLSPPSAAA